MFRFLFFILIIALVVYGVFNGLSPFQNGVKDKIATDYKLKLDEALAKHVPEQKTFDVTFFRGEFTGETMPEDFENNGVQRDSHFPESVFNQRGSGNLPSYQDYTSPSAGNITGNSGGNTVGNSGGNISSGLSNNTAQNTATHSTGFASNNSGLNMFNQECHGIIFDPCIPEVDYGAPRDELIFEKAPVAYYNGPRELPF